MTIALDEADQDEGRLLRSPLPHVFRLSYALAVVGAIAAALTFFMPGILTGPDVTNGNARGTAVVMLVLAVPVLLISMRISATGSWRAPLVWLGTLGYMLYNSFLLLFLTPFNSLFPLYVALFSLSLFSIGALVRALDPGALAGRLAGRPVRGLALYVWTIVFLNLLAWLAVIGPALGADDPPSFMDGAGVATNPLYIQDLAFWFPMAVLGAWWLWNRRPLGFVVVGAWLAWGVMESVGVAVDQWFGYRADPGTTFATEAGMYLFIGLTLVGLVPLYFFYRADREPASHGGSPV